MPFLCCARAQPPAHASRVLGRKQNAEGSRRCCLLPSDRCRLEPMRTRQPRRCSRIGITHTHAPGPTSPREVMAGPASRSRLASRCPENRRQRADGRPDDPPPAPPSQLAVPDARRRAPETFCPLIAVPLPSELTHACVVGLGRFERPTSRLSGVRSDQLSYRPRSRRQRAAGSRRRRLLPSESCLLIRKGCVDGDPGRLLGRCHASCPMPQRLRLLTSDLCPLTSDLRKEVIQPQVPLRLPCYDFTPVADLTVDGCPPCGLAHRLRVKPTPMV
jgi:hypothetical protein